MKTRFEVSARENLLLGIKDETEIELTVYVNDYNGGHDTYYGDISEENAWQLIKELTKILVSKKLKRR